MYPSGQSYAYVNEVIPSKGHTTFLGHLVHYETFDNPS
jgi:hypothetical protein